MAAAVILAGGQSRRFGEDKAFYQVGKRLMVEVVADVLRPEFDEVMIAGGDVIRFKDHGLVCYPDPVRGKGGLGGIYNGLMHTTADWFFCCGCDMPLLQPEVVGTIVRNLGDEDVLLPVINDVRQPLHAVYKRSILPTVERLVREANSFLPDLFNCVNVRYFDERDLSHIPDYQLSFVSLNSAEAVSLYKPHLDNL